VSGTAVEVDAIAEMRGVGERGVAVDDQPRVRAGAMPGRMPA
jgi:hypothetical protein